MHRNVSALFNTSDKIFNNLPLRFGEEGDRYLEITGFTSRLYFYKSDREASPKTRHGRNTPAVRKEDKNPKQTRQQPQQPFEGSSSLRQPYQMGLPDSEAK